jgi:hypothetical protein
MPVPMVSFSRSSIALRAQGLLRARSRERFRSFVSVIAPAAVGPEFGACQFSKPARLVEPPS